MWTGVPETEKSSRLCPLVSNGGEEEIRTRHLTLCGRCRIVERTAAPPSECAKMTSGFTVLIEEAMSSIAAMIEDGESPAQNL